MPLSMAIKQRAVRGATLNRESTRFNLPQTHEDGDWLDARAAIDGAPPPLRTTVTIEKPKTILPFNASPDIRSEAHTSEPQSLMRISSAVFCLKQQNTKLQHIIYSVQSNSTSQFIP